MEKPERRLLESDLASDPMRQFQAWFEEARTAGVVDPEAMALATTGRGGRPSVRMVLMRGLTDDSLVFFTDYESRKGEELAQNPRCALLFFWQPQARQVRMEGSVVRIAAEESDEYFASRPRGSRISAVLSRQSRPAPPSGEIERRYEELETQLRGRPVPRPERWGGFRFAPESVEFWQGRAFRLHDRFLYEKDADGSWKLQRLYP